MKRLIVTMVLLLGILTAGAVLKEKDLPHTLGVLKAELKNDYEKQKVMIKRYESMNDSQHAQLISYMKRSEQIGLILYSQKTDFTFDMAYACQEATQLYRQLTINTLPYDRIMSRINQEIERYTELIALLKQMPPVVGDAVEELTEVDTLLLQVADSLAEANVVPLDVHGHEDEEAVVNEPFLLDEEERVNRKECLFYAEEMLKTLEFFKESITNEQSYYDQVAERVKKLNEFAQSRYKILQNSIFKDGGSNYFSLLMSFPRQLEQVERDFVTKYKPLEDEGTGKSEWRGMFVMFISIFMVVYITLAMGVSNLLLRFCIPRKWRTLDFRQKRRTLIATLGVALFSIFVMVARTFTDRNVVLMATSLMITFAWLLGAILLSLLVRLDGDQIKSGARVYTPFIAMAFVVIVFRIILIPNSLVNLIYPLILLLFTLWQLRVLKKHKSRLPQSDMFYSSISAIAMVVACVAAWAGYTLFAVEIMMWWMFQLTAIQTITCMYDMIQVYERKKLIYKLLPSLKADEEAGMDTTAEKEELMKQVKAGEHFGKTWFYDFVHKSAVPILGVLSILLSIFWAAQIFEMTSICREGFMYNFIDQKDVIQLSLYKICLVGGCWYLFRYINYTLRSIYHIARRRSLGGSTDYNATLANNVIAILVWGGYCIFALVLLQVPKTGISVVTAGLATGMGFAMKDLLENFFYGISLMSGRVRVGDYIECDGIRGKVESISYQSTMICTTDGCVIAFLNSSLFSKNFKNLTRNHQYELVKIPVGVAYGCDVQAVREMLVTSLQEICQEESPSGKRYTDENANVTVAFSNFGDNSVDLLINLWVLVEEKAVFVGRVKEIIYNTLNQNHIDIPFPQRDVYLHQVN